MLNKKQESFESNVQKQSNDSYTTKLIAQTLQFRDKYFDASNALEYRNLKLYGDSTKAYTLKDVMKRFSNNDESIKEAIEITSTDTAKAYIKEYENELIDIFTHLANLMSHPSRNIAAGHDSVHAAYDGYEILDYINGIDDPVEKVASYLGSLVHDAGRTDEIQFRGGQTLNDDHAYFSIMYLMQELKNISAKFREDHADLDEEKYKEIDKIATAFFKRIINGVILHPGFNDLRDPVFHNVQSLDRLAGIFGQRLFVRMLFADGLHHNHPIMPDDKDAQGIAKDYSENTPNTFNVKGEYSIFHKLEQLTRGTFYKPVTLSLETGNKNADEQMRTGLIVLMLLSGGYDTTLFAQTFHPELVDGTREEFNNAKGGKKGVLPDEFKKMIQERSLMTSEEENAMQRVETLLVNADLHALFEIVFAQQAMFVSQEDKEHFFEYFDKIQGVDNKYNNDNNLREALIYTIIRRELDRNQELKIINDNLENEDQYKKSIAEKSLQHPLWTTTLDSLLEKYTK